MIAIKDAKWSATIEGGDDCWWWMAQPLNNTGSNTGFTCDPNYKTKRGAINNWKKFAKLNGITKYTIEVEE